MKSYCSNCKKNINSKRNHQPRYDWEYNYCCVECRDLDIENTPILNFMFPKTLYKLLRKVKYENKQVIIGSKMNGT